LLDFFDAKILAWVEFSVLEDQWCHVVGDQLLLLEKEFKELDRHSQLLGLHGLHTLGVDVRKRVRLITHNSIFRAL
jgi:hypothetical protein